MCLTYIQVTATILRVFEIFRNYVRDESSSFSNRRSGRFSLAAGISSEQLQDALRRAVSAVYKYDRSFTVESAAVFSVPSHRRRCHANFLPMVEFSIYIRATKRSINRLLTVIH